MWPDDIFWLPEVIKGNFWDVLINSVDDAGGFVPRLRDIFVFFQHSSRVWHHNTRNLPVAALRCGVSASGEDNVLIADAPGVLERKSVVENVRDTLKPS